MSGKVLVGLASGALFLALAFWGVPLAQLGEAFAALELPWLVPIAGLYMVQQLLRAWRQQMLVHAVKPGSTWWSHFGILCMSFFCINTLPARIGEVVRPWLLSELEDVPLGAGFGVVFAERAIDLIFVLATLSAILLLADVPMGPVVIGDMSWDVVELGRGAALGVLPPVLAIVIGLVFFGEPVMRVLRWCASTCERLLPFAVVRRVMALAVSFSQSFSEGLAAFRSPSLLAKVGPLTLVIWGMTGWIYVMLAHALGFGELIGWLESMGVLVITMLGSTVPAPPGMAGVYEAFVRAALAVFGVRGEGLDGPALAFALIAHWWLYGVQASSAMYFFWRRDISLARVWDVARRGLAQLRGGE